MMIYELDDIEKRALLDMAIDRARADLNDGRPLTEMRRWVEFTIAVNLKVPKVGPGYRRERFEFRFCAQSREDARALALCNVPSRGYETEFQVIEALPLFGEVKETEQC